MISGISNTNPVTHAQPNTVQHQAPAKPAPNKPTETTPQDDKVQLSSAAKQASSGDIDHDGDSR
jgi:hypothetical protein